MEFISRRNTSKFSRSSTEDISRYTKEVQIPPKSNPRGHLKPKNESDGAKSKKKSILGGRVRRRARQKDPKVDLQTGPRAPKSKIYVLYQKNMICGVSLEATEAAFGG